MPSAKTSKVILRDVIAPFELLKLNAFRQHPTQVHFWIYEGDSEAAKGMTRKEEEAKAERMEGCDPLDTKGKGKKMKPTAVRISSGSERIWSGYF